MYETAAVLMASEIREDLASLTKAEDMLRVAFKNAFNHWMFTDEQDQFKGAVGAVLLRLRTGPEYDRVNVALRSLSRFSAILNALQAGVPVDFEALNAQDDMPKADEVISLNQMWCDVKWPKDAQKP